MFITALSSIAKTWKQPKCPLAEMDKQDVVYMYNGILLSHRKNEIVPFAATCMDLEIIILSEVSQTEKYIYHITYICNLKYGTNKLNQKLETSSQI